MFYQRQNNESKFETLNLGQSLDLVIGMTGKESLTAETVAQVRRSWQQYPDRYEAIFDQIGALTQSAQTALQNGQLQEIGELMNLCHGYLNALQLSTPKLEDLIHIARTNGAVGAKLTGGGGGGSMVALCPDSSERVRSAMQAAGYKTLSVTLD